VFSLDDLAQLTSSNAILEATCSSAAEAAKRIEAQQQELAACKDKLVEVTTLRELMKIAQTAQGAAEQRCKDLQAQLDEQTKQVAELRKTSWEYQQQVVAQQSHVSSMEKLLDVERAQNRQQAVELTECRRKVAVADELLQSGQLRMVSAEVMTNNATLGVLWPSLSLTRDCVLVRTDAEIDGSRGCRHARVAPTARRVGLSWREGHACRGSEPTLAACRRHVIRRARRLGRTERNGTSVGRGELPSHDCRMATLSEALTTPCMFG
jgi:hypothetical protein